MAEEDEVDGGVDDTMLLALLRRAVDDRRVLVGVRYRVLTGPGSPLQPNLGQRIAPPVVTVVLILLGFLALSWPWAVGFAVLVGLAWYVGWGLWRLHHLRRRALTFALAHPVNFIYLWRMGALALRLPSGVRCVGPDGRWRDFVYGFLAGDAR